MTHIFGFERSQLLLLPEAVDDYVGVDNPVRFIDQFVDELDLATAGFNRVRPKATGRPGYAPGDLLKLYIYGYLNRVRSSRRLEAESHRNVEVIWLLRTLKPDFKTIADFRSENRTAFKAVFRQFTLLCKDLKLFGRELLAVDVRLNPVIGTIGHPDVVDADLADYFGSIPHTDLLKPVARRIVDRRVLHLIKMWLDCPVEETDQRSTTCPMRTLYIPGRREFAGRITRVSIQFPFLQPHTHAAAVLRNEFDSGLFEGALHGLNSSRRHGPPASLEFNNR